MNDAAFLSLLLQVDQDFSKPEHPHRNLRGTEAVGQLWNAEGEARHPRVHVGSDESHQQPEDDHRHRLEQRAVRENDRADQAEDHQREVFRRPELQRQLGHRHREGRQQEDAHATRKEGPEARDRERGAGPALSRHLVTVDAGHRG